MVLSLFLMTCYAGVVLFTEKDAEYGIEEMNGEEVR